MQKHPLLKRFPKNSPVSKKNAGQRKTAKEKPKKPGSDKPHLTNELQEKLIEFLEQTPPGAFSRNLRRMFFIYLSTDDGVGSLYLDETLRGLEALFEFLDVAYDDWEKCKLKEIC